MGSQFVPSSGGAYFSSSSPSSASAAAWQPVEVGVQQICYLLSQSVKPGANQAEVRGLRKPIEEKETSPPVAAAVPVSAATEGCRLSLFHCSFFRVRAHLARCRDDAPDATATSVAGRREASVARKEKQQQASDEERKSRRTHAPSLPMLVLFRSRVALSCSSLSCRQERAICVDLSSGKSCLCSGQQYSSPARRN